MATTTIKLADYLFARLKQLGVEAVHGVPGDYNLTLLDHVEPSGLLWVGNANELNAGYAADGYARIKGIGALITTFGVGELSAINAIAGAFTERAAVVHIVGTPPRRSQDLQLMIHHTLGDGNYRHFGHMHSHVTVAQTNLLDPRTAPEQIDNALRQCLIHSRPVYIEVPVDMVGVPVSDARLENKVSAFDSVPDPNLEIAVTAVLAKVYAARSPIILVDGETRSLGLSDAINSLIESTGWPTFTTNSGKGLIDMTLPNVYGIYRGSSANSTTQSFFANADLVLSFGPHLSSTNTYNWTSVPDSKVTVSFTHSGIKIGSEILYQVSVQESVRQMLQRLDQSKVTRYDAAPELPRDGLLFFSDVSATDNIKQDKVWRLLANFIRPGDIILGETGTAGYGVREMPLPKHTRLFTPITWLSIGYMLPACQGAALAQRELLASNKYHDLQQARTILLIGDGSFQMTAQELSTIIRLGLNVVVFLINNDGYTIERCIHGVNQKYNDISFWRYLQAPALFGAPDDTFIAQARTYRELEQVLKEPRLVEGNGLRMVEVCMDKLDAPIGPLMDLMNKQREAVKG